VNGYLLHHSAPIAARGRYARREAIPPQHTRTATVFARLLEHLPPLLAEKYVLPWAGGTPKIDRLCAAITSATTRPARQLASSQAGLPALAVLCREAMHQAWRDGTGPGGSMFEDAAQRAVDGLTGEDAADCLAVLASARPVDTYLATQLLAAVARQAGGSTAGAGRQAAHRWLPFLASTVRACGSCIPAKPVVPGAAVGRLVRYRPDGRAARHEGTILLVDQPLPPQAPVLLAARGVISCLADDPYQPRAGSGRGVPTVTACHPETATGAEAADGSWLAAIDGATGEVALLAR
jgi:hypothetical protein